jgi:PAS domain S-box-containing protein
LRRFAVRDTWASNLVLRVDPLPASASTAWYGISAVAENIGSPMTYRPWPSVIVATVFAALLIGLAVVNRVNAERAEASAQSVAHTYAVTTELAEMLATLVDAETGQRGFVITGEDRYLQPYQSAVANVHAHIDRVAALTADNPDQQADLPLVRSLMEAKLAELEESIRVRRTVDFAAAAQIVATDRGKRVMGDIRSVAARMSTREQTLLQTRETAAQRSSRRARWAAVATTALAVAAVGLVWFGFRRDALQRAGSMAAIANEREHLRVTLLGLGDAVIVVNASGNISMMNPIAESLTGWSQREAMGIPASRVFNIVNEETRRPVTNPLTVVLETGTAQGLANHTVLIAADGTERPIDDSAAPIRDTAGVLLGAVLVFRDISSRRAAERQLSDAFGEAEANRTLAERREQDLKHALDVKNQFLATVSHELRTPINVIAGWATQLRAGTRHVRDQHAGAGHRRADAVCPVTDERIGDASLRVISSDTALRQARLSPRGRSHGTLRRLVPRCEVCSRT